MKAIEKQHLIGTKINSLKILGIVKIKPAIFFSCKCVCGVDKLIRATSVINEKTKSCGCQQKNLVRAANLKHGFITGRHQAAEYKSWASMKDRCLNKNNHGYHYYGGRGITVCERWGSFENFIADMGKKPSSKHSIDRINNNGNYEPSNCRWATARQQQLNRRNCKKYKQSPSNSALIARKG